MSGSRVKSSSEIGIYSLTFHHDSEDRKYALITGSMTDSALWISDYAVTYHDDSVVVTINRILNKTGNNGPYYIKFFLPESVNRIILGDETVWQRSPQEIQTVD
jgi:hypothetical protein